MAETATLLDDADVRARWGDFEWIPVNALKAGEIVARYPPGRQASAIMPLLDLAQRQVGMETRTQGWLPVPVIEYVARQIDMPFIRAYEVATFYTMYNLAPVGRFHVQLCGTTPCLLRGSDDVIAACKARGLAKGQTTADGLFTLTEVECLGACANAPMVQINDDNYEDLTFETMTAVLDALARGDTPTPGSQIGRQASCPEGGATSLFAFAQPLPPEGVEVNVPTPKKPAPRHRAHSHGPASKASPTASETTEESSKAKPLHSKRPARSTAAPAKPRASSKKTDKPGRGE